jgi:YfiH family protein
MTPLFIEPDWPAPAAVIALSSTRHGGHSSAPYDSFNLAHHVGDSTAAVAANRNILHGTLGPDARVQWLSQVHGVNVVEAGVGEPYPEADAVWTRRRGIACAVLTADCLPVLFCAANGEVVAAAHAGWRGLLAGVLEATVAAMAVDSAQILAWLGPAIGPASFEIGPEVREQYLDTIPGAQTAACFSPSRANPDHYYADLYALARIRLDAAGVSRICGGKFCTFGDSRRFYSYRRDGLTGRMASLVMLDSRAS